MRLAFAAITFFAEDSREEKSGATTIVGILPDRVAVPSVPGAMPKIAIYTRLHVPVETEINDASVWMRSPTGEETELSVFDAEMIKSAQADSIANGSRFFGLVSQAVASPFPVFSLGRFEVFVRSGGLEELTGALEVIIGEPDSPPLP